MAEKETTQTIRPEGSRLLALEHWEVVVRCMPRSATKVIKIHLLVTWGFPDLLVNGIRPLRTTL